RPLPRHRARRGHLVRGRARGALAAGARGDDHAGVDGSLGLAHAAPALLGARPRGARAPGALLHATLARGARRLVARPGHPRPGRFTIELVAESSRWLRRLLRPLWIALAIVFLFEGWLWDRLAAIGTRIAHLIALPAWRARLAALIERLPPAATL